MNSSDFKENAVLAKVSNSSSCDIYYYEITNAIDIEQRTYYFWVQACSNSKNDSDFSDSEKLKIYFYY